MKLSIRSTSVDNEERRLLFMLFKKIPEAELEVMKVIWKNESSISSKEIIGILEEKKGWKRTTSLTLLSRLAERDFITAEKGKRITYYQAKVSEKSYLGMETVSFFKNVHGNSLKSFITTLHDNNNISNDELDELENWIKNR